jgi:hypothetical protein
MQMGFLDKLFGRKKDDAPAQAEATPAAAPAEEAATPPAAAPADEGAHDHDQPHDHDH